MKIIMILDQIQSGMGTKDDAFLPLGGKRVAIGPAVMMEQALAEVDGQILACLYCGTSYFLKDPKTVSHKFCAMIEKLHPDVVVCGPAYDYKDYAYMSAYVAKAVSDLHIPVMAAMSQENGKVLAQYKDSIPIVITPAKGEGGLQRSLYNICQLARQMVDGKVEETFRKKICF